MGREILSSQEFAASGCLFQLSLGDPPFVAFAASRTARQKPLVSDAEERLEFALDANVDRLAGIWAMKVQALHRGLLSEAVRCDAKWQLKPASGWPLQGLLRPAATIDHLAVSGDGTVF
jgi:hypothetical protein